MLKTFLIFFGVTSMMNNAQAASNTELSMKLYNQIRQERGNLFFSPYSVGQALSLAAAGSGSATKTELTSFLGTPPSPLKVQSIDWSESNHLWIRHDLKLASPYQERVRKNLKAEVSLVDFASSPENARILINKAVAKQTREKIQDLLPPGFVDVSTQSVLTNAVYFKAPWTDPFDLYQTREQAFNLLDGKQVMTKMMAQTKYFDYGENKSVQWLSLDYGDSRSAKMTVIAPRKAADFSEFEKSLTQKDLQKYLTTGTSERVYFEMPKFKISTGLPLTEPLKKAGLKIAFSPQANFSLIFDPKPTVPFFISAVVHKAWIDVNESGTEAAAATAVGMVGGAAMPAKPKEFKLNRPFLFVISGKTDNEDVILFMGRVIKP